MVFLWAVLLMGGGLRQWNFGSPDTKKNYTNLLNDNIRYKSAVCRGPVLSGCLKQIAPLAPTIWAVLYVGTVLMFEIIQLILLLLAS
jgi:hypothetical protein